jgi:hypothetical protein
MGIGKAKLSDGRRVNIVGDGEYDIVGTPMIRIKELSAGA